MLKKIILNKEPQNTTIEVGSIVDYKSIVAWNGTHTGVILYDIGTEKFYIKWSGSSVGNASDSNAGWRDLIEELISCPRLVSDKYSIEFYTLK